jgi:small subunit ribosomal protein S16
VALRIRLTRVGAKKHPIYRIVVSERLAPRDGRFIEIVGHYNPNTDPAQVSLKEDRIRHWLSKGATPSETVGHLLKRHLEPVTVETTE